MPLTDGLIAHYKLDAAGLTTDSKGSFTLTNNGTVTTTTGKVGEAGNFVAASSQNLSVTVSGALSFGDTDFEVGCWVKLASKGSNRTILAEYAAVTSCLFLAYDSAQDKFRWTVVTQGGTEFTIYANELGSPSLDTWYYVSAWHDAANNLTGISVNAGTATTGSHSGGTGAAAGSLRIGGNDAGVWYWDGQIDAVDIYSRLRTSDERTSVYNGGAGLAYADYDTTTVAVNNAALLAGLSPYNWERSGSSYIRAVNGGAFLKFQFSGTQLKLGTDTSAFSGVNSSRWPRLRCSLDGAGWFNVAVASTTTTVCEGQTDTTHTIEIYLDGIDAYTARWDGTMSLKITSVILDSGKSLTAYADLRPNRLLWFGDSIDEGGYVTGAVDFTAYAQRMEATGTVPFAIAYQLDAELGCCAFGGQSWDDTFNSDVPALPSAWNLIKSGVSRLSSGLLSPAPTYIVCGVCANGGVDDPLTVVQWLEDVRAAAGSACKIYMLVAYGGTGRANLVAGVDTYQVDNPTDDRVYLIDVGDTEGITDTSGAATMLATDGLHPNRSGNLVLAAKVGAAIAEAVPPLDAAGIRAAVGLASANLDTQFDAIPTAAQNADAVLDEALSGHATAGTAGKALSDVEDAGAITIAPILATSNQTRYTVKDMAPMIAGSGQADQWTITDSTGAAASQAGDTIRFVVASIEYATLNADPFSDDFTAAWTRQTGGDGVVISGAGSNLITVTQDPADVVAGEYVYWLLNLTDRIPLATGKWPVKPIVAGAWT